MGLLLYRLAGVGASEDEIRRAYPGLAYAMPRRDFSCRGTTEGALYANTSNGLGLRLEPAKQEWNAHELEGVQFGWAKDARPGPTDLLRRECSVESHSVVLGDGNAWRIPIVRRCPEGTALPRVIVLDDEGRPVFRVLREYQELWDVARVLWEEAQTDTPQRTWSPEALLGFAALALGVNYRLGLREIAALELIGTENVREIADALLDGPNWRALQAEYEKKKASGASLPGPDS